LDSKKKKRKESQGVILSKKTRAIGKGVRISYSFGDGKRAVEKGYVGCPIRQFCGLTAQNEGKNGKERGERKSKKTKSVASRCITAKKALGKKVVQVK